jgi:hypothetical protein
VNARRLAWVVLLIGCGGGGNGMGDDGAVPDDLSAAVVDLSADLSANIDLSVVDHAHVTPPDLAPLPCNSLTCAGCCDPSGACVSGRNASACGVGGAACQACPNGDSCAVGACSSCNASTCASGCCSGTTCNSPTVMSCG